MRSVLSISLPKKITAALNKYAKATGRNKSDIAKESISLYLWEMCYRGTRKRLAAKAKKAGIVSKDDFVILKAISPPVIEDFDCLIADTRKKGRLAGIKPSDITAAVSKVRGRK